jgi:hypothetical protein
MSPASPRPSYRMKPWTSKDGTMTVNANGAEICVETFGWPQDPAILLIATTAGGPDLPPPAERVSKMFRDPLPSPDWTDRVARLDCLS